MFIREFWQEPGIYYHFTSWKASEGESRAALSHFQPRLIYSVFRKTWVVSASHHCCPRGILLSGPSPGALKQQGAPASTLVQGHLPTNPRAWSCLQLSGNFFIDCSLQFLQCPECLFSVWTGNDGAQYYASLTPNSKSSLHHWCNFSDKIK